MFYKFLYSLIGTLIISLSFNNSFARFSELGDQYSLKFKVNSEFGEANIYIHGYEADKKFMDKAKKVFEQDALSVFSFFKYVPRDTIHVVVDSDIHIANGAATVIPKNTIYLYNYPPSSDGLLLASDDWIRTVIVHELAHVVHMDKTEGFPNFVRNVFGSIGKWGGITPRWFVEGIAVHVETELTEGGRNRYIMNDIAFRDFLLTKACDDVSCLSYAPIYPYQGLAYIAGGKFMEFLENKRPGAIRCLVDDNSSNVPFFLSSAFNNCFDRSPNSLFQEFQGEELKVVREEQRLFKFSKLAKLSEKIELTPKGDSFWDSGSALINDEFVYASYFYHSQYINRVNINTKKTESFRYEDKLDSLLPQTENLRDANQYLVGSYDIDGDDYTRKWAMYDSKTNKKITDVSLDNETQYLFKVNETDYFALRFENDSWGLYNNDGKVLNLEKFRVLNRPFITKVGSQNYLVFKSFYKGFFELQLLNLKNYVRKNIYSSKESFNLVGHYKDNFFINRPFVDDDKLLVLKTNGRSFTSKLEESHELARIYSSGKQILFLHKNDPKSVYKFNGTGEEFIGVLRGRSSYLSGPKYTQVDIAAEDKSVDDTDYFDYPTTMSLLPGYWIFGTYSDEDTRSYFVSTSFSDPLENHLLTISPEYVEKPSEFGGSASYKYQYYDDHYVGIMGNKSSEFFNIVENFHNEEYGAVFLQSLFMNGRFYFPAIVSFIKEREHNLRSPGVWSYGPNGAGTYNDYHLVTNKEQSLSVKFGVSNLPKFNDSFFNGYIFSIQGSKVYNEESYIGHHSEIKTSFASRFSFNHRFTTSVYATYQQVVDDERNFNTGEASEDFSSINSSEIFGDKITTAGIEFNLLGFKPYRGYSTWPIFFKDINYTAGVDYVQADNIYVDNMVSKDDALFSPFIGLKTDLRLAYMFDTSLVFKYSTILDTEEDSFTFAISFQ